MAVVLSGSTNDITIGGVSVATDTEVSSAIASGVAPKANTADLKEIGVGQTWQNVGASRIGGTTYTNSTGKPIMVCIALNTTYSGSRIFTIDGVQVDSIIVSSTVNMQMWIRSIVPNNSTYSFNGSFTTWMELR